MRKHELYSEYHDHFEYFGNTEIERIRKQGEKTIRHDRIIFDSTDAKAQRNIFLTLYPEMMVSVILSRCDVLHYQKTCITKIAR